MFYDVLIEKRAAKKKQESSRRKDALKGVGVGVAGMAGGAGLAAGSKALGRRAVRPDQASMENLLTSMGARKTTSTYGFGRLDPKTGQVTPQGRRGEIYELVAKDGRKIELQLGAGKEGNLAAYYSPDSRRKRSLPNSRGTIRLDRGIMDEDVFFHELGHATGRGSKTRYQKPLDDLSDVIGGKAGMAAEMLGGLGAAGMASSARTKQEADRANMAANTVLGLSALRHLPTLGEEARASIRAYGLKKKFMGGKTPGARILLPSYGTYLGNALLHAAPGIAAKVMAKRKQRQFRSEKEK